jgi:hypothetical protein
MTKKMNDETTVEQIDVVDAKPIEQSPEKQNTSLTARQGGMAGMGDILALIREGIVSKASVDVVKELREIWRDEKRDRAAEAFANALVQFRKLVKPILMTGMRDDRKTMKRDGTYGSVHYPYAELTTTMEQIQPALDQCYLTPTWKTVKNDPGWVEIECIVTHISNHSESSGSLGAPPEGSSGQTAVQKRIGTTTSLRRATLFMVLGLTTTEDDAHLKDQEQGDDEPGPPESQRSITDPERAIKEQFVITCRQKTGNPKLPNTIVVKIFAAAQEACGSESAKDCLDWIKQGRVAIGSDGTLAVAVPPEAAQTDESLDALDQTELPIMRWECLKCKKQFRVKPAQCPCGSTLGCKQL